MYVSPFEQRNPVDMSHKVTTDIYDDAERQNLTLDDAVRPSNPALFLAS